jgi:DNA-binding transcriptional regulator YdaS (Cro superfamily)
MESLQRRGLRKAAQLVGGREPLGELLGADPAALDAWMNGEQSVPPPVFLAVVEMLADAESVTEL